MELILFYAHHAHMGTSYLAQFAHLTVEQINLHSLVTIHA